MRTTVVAVALLSLTACADRFGAEPSLASAVPISPGDPITLPMDAYFGSSDAAIVLSNARDRLIRDCMATRGFDYPVVVRQVNGQGDHQRRYGITNLSRALSSGYRPPPGDLVDAETLAKVGQFYEQLSEEGGLALMGPETAEHPYSPDSCFGQAQEALQLHNYDAGQARIDELMASAHARFEGDSRVADVNAAWSECMEEHGFRYSDPLSVGDDPRWSGVVTELEIQVATRDIECKESTDYLSIVVAVESAYQNSIIEDESSRLSQFADETRAALEAASRIQASVSSSG